MKTPKKSTSRVDPVKAAILSDMKERLENLPESELKYIAGALAAFTAFETDSKQAGVPPPDKAS